ncbi:sterol O-acyltransferase 2 [Xenopus tropicalis]|uniref:O-acyltransferase n=1 Tax=Xenopus tropicalis TaxID=8364 RepID=B5DFR6_XENTR|nr:sterol O-acyltransferase 2 [Xenopus tropicalis]AAI69163.1 Unknown (protein for MGC:189636) [Xenopus tropicalis]|eukprot:XP_017946603.1 PREDICTED: sterol O-acyltransferase 2 isoform X1 [Xenopus tropicalis]
MAPVEEKEEDSLRQRKNHHPKEAACNGKAGGLSDGNGINGLIEWKRHMEGVKAELVEEMSCHLKDLLDKAVAETMHSYKRKIASALSSKKDHVNNKRHQGSISEKQKVFMHRASLLDDLMEVEHFRTIYHMFVAVLCVFVINTTAVDIIDQGRLFLDLDLLFYTFGQLSTVVWTWLCLFMYTLLVPYRALHVLGSLYPESSHPLLLSAFIGGLLLVCQIFVLGVLPIYVVTQYKLPPASSFIVILEQVRFLMKSYSFLRECVPLLLRKEKKDIQLPKFSSYLYFLFCPTLIYRESYPRTPYIRWNFVAKNFAQFLGCLFFGYYVLFTLCIPVFTNMSKQPFSNKTLVLSIFHATLPGTFVLLLSFFAFLHCWLNAFAEMLRFADRMFYEDWWNSTSFSNYYRTWNVVVHDWLYYYVYRDLLSLCNQRYRAGIMLTVFLLSASVHEYVFTLSLRYFYPVLFCLFAIFGVLFNFMMNDKRKSPVWNVMVWTFLFIGQGIQLCLYSQEWYAQIHCPLTEKTFWGLVTPRSWSCRL